MLKLASIEAFLAIVVVVCSKEIIWNCYGDYKECVAESSKMNYVAVDNVEFRNLIEFCSDHTQNILPCLATKLGLIKSMSVSMFSLLLAICETEIRNNRPAATEVQQILKYLARFYAYFCAYSNVIDLHYNRECFQNLKKRCILNKPDDSCIFYQCGKKNLNLSESSQFIQQHKTTKIINQLNQSATFKNRQHRITAVFTVIITFISMIQ
ncbi:hypothetical protein X798_01176 [Onchocerca flexuosa]|uniref:Uncharacterized protein n=1 Tax=Onchocerca flexuosa TaxID=387005 RepID=A0A238C4C7_9BILA|nr:hypothetical protein X798_01176 [Onchocerca flexuosa]